MRNAGFDGATSIYTISTHAPFSFAVCVAPRSVPSEFPRNTLVFSVVCVVFAGVSCNDRTVIHKVSVCELE